MYVRVPLELSVSYAGQPVREAIMEDVLRWLLGHAEVELEQVYRDAAMAGIVAVSKAMKGEAPDCLSSMTYEVDPYKVAEVINRTAKKGLCAYLGSLKRNLDQIQADFERRQPKES